MSKECFVCKAEGLTLYLGICGPCWKTANGEPKHSEMPVDRRIGLHAHAMRDNGDDGECECNS